MCIVVVLERRRSAVDRNHVRTGPGPRVGVRIVCVVFRVITAEPRTKHVADFMHHRMEERSIARLFDAATVILVEGIGTSMRFPVVTRSDAAGTAPSGQVSSQVDPGYVNDKAGAGLSSRPDTNFPPVSAVVSDQSTFGLARPALPLLPCVVNPLTPGLPGTFECRLERSVVAHVTCRMFEVELDGEGVGGTARPASIGHAVAPAEHCDGIVILKARCGRIRAHAPGGLKQGLKIGDIAVCVRRLRQARGHRPAVAMSPVIEKIVCKDVVLRPQRYMLPAR